MAERPQHPTKRSIVAAVAMVAYPVGVYFAFAHLPARIASLVLLAVFVPAVVARLGGKTRQVVVPLAFLPAVTVGLLGVSAVLDTVDVALLVPVAINAALLSGFVFTLWREPPMIERFARLQVDDLSSAELRWCRGWTWGWAAFFFVNGAVALVLARGADLQAWTVYNGLVAYVLMGTMFGVEYVLRKYRFGRLGDNPLDRLLRAGFEALGKSTESPR